MTKETTGPWWVALLAVVVLAGVGYAIWQSDRQPGQNSNGEVADVATSTWVTYRNETFGFEIKHPGSWRVAEFPDHQISPIINIYKPDGQLPPFDHFSDATHVSIYPEGIPTEGVPGQRIQTNTQPAVPVEQASDFVLTDGSRFATIINFSASRPNWNTSGFLWAKVRIENESERCFRNDQELTMEQCDYLTGDTVTRSGTINTTDRLIEEAMISSFRFLP